MLKAVSIPSIYNERYAQISKKTRTLGCAANNKNTPDKTMGTIPIINFNSFHLSYNIAQI